MTPGTVPAIQVLRRVFSTSNLARHAPEMYSIRALRKLYLCAHARGTLSDLSDTQFSAIIALFGTLSVPNPPNEFKSPLAQHTEKRQSRAWWGFILQMVQDKKRVTGILKGCDLYWLMRARASGTSLNDLNMYVGNGEPRLMIARELYLTRDVNSITVDNHVSYLKALLSLKKQDATIEAIAWLCYLMKRDIYCPPGLLGILWDVVLNADQAFPVHLKEKIMDLISQRLALPVDFSDEARARFTSLAPEPEADTPEKHPSFCLTASDLARQVVRILFPRVTPSLSGTVSQLVIQEWAHAETQLMFSPSARMEYRWQNLVYLALASTRSSLQSSSTVPTLQTVDCRHRPSAVDFRVVATIALIERATDAHGISSDLHDLIRALWASWVDIANNDAHAHYTLVRPLLGTFFRLAARARDASLVTSCVRLASVGFWQFDLGDDVARRQAQLLAVEYLAAAVVSGDTLWERIIKELPPHIVFPQWHPMLLSKVILRIARLDAQRAVDIFNLWRRYLPVPDLSVPLSPMLVQEGRVDLAIPLLADINFTGPFLGVILRPLAKQGSWYIDLELATILANAVLTVFASEAPPRTATARRDVGWVLLALACSGQAPAAITTFKNVYMRDPRFFNDCVIHTFLCTLLYHRQFSGAAEIAKLFPHTRWRQFVLYGLTKRGGAPRIEAHLGGSVRPGWVKDVVARVRSGRRHPAAGLLRHWVTRRARSSSDVRNGLKVLARARGIGLAQRVYQRMYQRHDAGTQTALGNVILDGHVAYARSRSARNVSGVLRMLRLLVEEHGFVPDRITTNIIVKAALRWPTVLDAALVRRLFDYFVWRGYPGEDADTGVPFGSGEAAMREAAVILGTPTPMPKSRMSFTRHVKPLYKMFIKALYLREDVAGARKVVGILKEAERIEIERLAKRRE
ncbi:hypothetical protein BC827DRAFT_1267959 [Russula dissimulans]|nr:hypothetical protein BC827DRAFT_1267959 [Russula dissimulans]